MLTKCGQVDIWRKQPCLLFPCLGTLVSMTSEVFLQIWAPRILSSLFSGTFSLVSAFVLFLKHTKHGLTSGPSPLFPWSEVSPHPAQQPHVFHLPHLGLISHSIFSVSSSWLPDFLCNFSPSQLSRSDILYIYSFVHCHLPLLE